jgi:uncharacterized protein DUF3124
MNTSARMLSVALASLATLACSAGQQDTTTHGSAALHLKKPSSGLTGPTIHRTVYVPVYSSIYWGLEVRRNIVDLAATLSVRNISAQRPIILNYVRYYDSAGKLVREYLGEPGELGPLASVEFVIQRGDTAGGPGANFLVQWVGQADTDEPLIEAVMIGQSGNAGISFTSTGRAIKNEPTQ